MRVHVCLFQVEAHCSPRVDASDASSACCRSAGASKAKPGRWGGLRHCLLHSCCLLLERERESACTCELMQRSYSCVSVWLEKWLMRQGLEWSSLTNTFREGAWCILHTCTNKHITFSTLHSTGVVSSRYSTPRVHAATTTASTRCLLGCRDVIELL